MKTKEQKAPKVALGEVILRPLVNEKTTDLREKQNQYVFQVHSDATKATVKQAVEKFFSVKVTNVRTLVTHGKQKRVGQAIGRRSNWKKAIVTLAQGQNIDLFGNG